MMIMQLRQNLMENEVVEDLLNLEKHMPKLVTKFLGHIQNVLKMLRMQFLNLTFHHLRKQKKL